MPWVWRSVFPPISTLSISLPSSSLSLSPIVGLLGSHLKVLRMPALAPKLTRRDSEHPVPRDVQAEGNQFQSGRLQRDSCSAGDWKHLGVLRLQGPTCDNIQDSFHGRRIRPMLRVFHEAQFMRLQGLAVFIQGLPYFIFIFFALRILFCS